MSVSITALTTDKTFSNWVTTTNELITFADNAVTLDANNTGNITLTGNFSLQNTGNVLTTNNISPVSGGKVTFAGQVEATDTITLNKSSGEAILQFQLADSDTFSIKTSASQTALVIGNSTHNITLAGTDGDITATGRIDNAMLPVNVSIDGTLTSTNAATFGTVDINGGAIDGVTLGTNSPVTSAVITTADINGGTIDGTTIGGSTAAAGSFTTIAASSNATVGGDLTVSGTITGDLTGTSTVASSLDSAALTQVFNAIYPVNSLYYTISSEDPATTFGGGWSRYGQGRAIVGFDDGLSVSSASHSSGTTTVNTSSAHYFAAGDVVNFSGFGGGNGNFTVSSTPSTTQFKVSRSSSNVSGGSSRKIKLASADAVNVTSGRNSITQSVSQMPEHKHDTNIRTEGSSIFFGGQSYTSGVPYGDCLDHLNKNTNNSTRTSEQGSGNPMSVQNRGVIVYIWKRDSLA